MLDDNAFNIFWVKVKMLKIKIKTLKSKHTMWITMIMMQLVTGVTHFNCKPNPFMSFDNSYTVDPK